LLALQIRDFVACPNTRYCSLDGHTVLCMWVEYLFVMNIRCMDWDPILDSYKGKGKVAPVLNHAMKTYGGVEV
jgi:hypothetical protein